jgi:hypothetical protein
MVVGAAQQPIHRPLAGQVLADRRHRLQLVRRLVVLEGGLELALQIALAAHARCLGELPLGVELEQVGGEL